MYFTQESLIHNYFLFILTLFTNINNWLHFTVV